LWLILLQYFDANAATIYSPSTYYRLYGAVDATCCHSMSSQAQLAWIQPSKTFFAYVASGLNSSNFEHRDWSAIALSVV
jgi:hypothetical protein